MAEHVRLSVLLATLPAGLLLSDGLIVRSAEKWAAWAEKREGAGMAYPAVGEEWDGQYDVTYAVKRMIGYGAAGGFGEGGYVHVVMTDFDVDPDGTDILQESRGWCAADPDSSDSHFPEARTAKAAAKLYAEDRASPEPWTFNVRVWRDGTPRRLGKDFVVEAPVVPDEEDDA